MSSSIHIFVIPLILFLTISEPPETAAKALEPLSRHKTDHVFRDDDDLEDLEEDDELDAEISEQEGNSEGNDQDTEGDEQQEENAEGNDQEPDEDEPQEEIADTSDNEPVGDAEDHQEPEEMESPTTITIEISQDSTESENEPVKEEIEKITTEGSVTTTVGEGPSYPEDETVPQKEDDEFVDKVDEIIEEEKFILDTNDCNKEVKIREGVLRNLEIIIQHRSMSGQCQFTLMCPAHQLLALLLTKTAMENGSLRIVTKNGAVNFTMKQYPTTNTQPSLLLPQTSQVYLVYTYNSTELTDLAPATIKAEIFSYTEMENHIKPLSSTTHTSADDVYITTDTPTGYHYF